VTTTPSIDVVVPTYNNRSELSACLDAIGEAKGLVAKVIVCVDGSTDDTKEWLGTQMFAFPIAVREHPDGRNHGRGPARNLSLPELTSEYVLFLDSDMRLHEDAIARHLELLAERDVVSIGEVSYDPRSSMWGRYQGTRGKNKSAPGAEVRALDFNTQNVALRSEHVLAVGGFDTTLAGYGGEDTELGLRLRGERRVPFVFNGRAVATTVEMKSVDQGMAQLDRFARTNLHAIRARHPIGAAPFWVDRLQSRRLQDRLLKMAFNPLGERLARAMLPRVPFVVQRRLLDYLVLQTVWRGCAEGPS
jgi:glycosyltransferase involved in cell wall biosynthesis